MEDITIPQQLEELRNLSTEVDDFLITEKYRDIYYGEEYTIEDILKDCYALVTEELADMGLLYSEDVITMLGDWFLARNNIYAVRKFFDVNNLLELCKLNEKIYQLFVNFTTEKNAPPDAIYRYPKIILELAMELNPNNYDYLRFADVVDVLHGNDDFVKYLQGVLGQLLGDPTVSLPDVERAAQYVRKIQLGRQAVTDATHLIISSLGVRVDMRNINMLLKRYDMDKINSFNLKTYAMLDTDDLNPHLIPYRNKVMQEHHERSQHHLEYWIVREGSIPTDENLILLVAHFYIPDMPEHAIQTEIDRLLNMGVKIFTPTQVDKIHAYGNILRKELSRRSTTAPANDTDSNTRSNIPEFFQLFATKPSGGIDV